MSMSWHKISIFQLYFYSSSDQESVAEFDLRKDTYPPMIFSRVKSYTAVTEAPLK